MSPLNSSSAVFKGETHRPITDKDEQVTGVMFYESSSTYIEKNKRFEFRPEFADVIQRFMRRNG